MHTGGNAHDHYCNGRCRFHRQQLYFLYVKGTSAGSHCLSGFPDLCGQSVHACTGDGSAEFSFRKTRYLRPSGSIYPFWGRKTGCDREFCSGVPCGPLHWESGSLFADQYYRYFRADGRMQEVWYFTVSSGIHGWGIRRSATGPSGSVLPWGYTDPHLQSLQHFQGICGSACYGIS